MNSCLPYRRLLVKYTFEQNKLNIINVFIADFFLFILEYPHG